MPAAATALLIWTCLPGRNVALFLGLNGLATRLPDAWWSCLTVLGDTLVALVLLLPLLRYRRAWVMAALLASVPATLATHGCKHWMHAARPLVALGDAVHVIGPQLHQGSFPSGHTTTAFVLAAVVMAGLRFSARSLLVAAVASLVGLSRIAVGAHWPVDVAAGALIGWTSGLVGVWLASWRPLARRPAPTAAVLALLVGCTLWLLFGYDSRYPLARAFEQAVALGALVIYLWSVRPAAAHTQATAPSKQGSAN